MSGHAYGASVKFLKPKFTALSIVLSYYYYYYYLKIFYNGSPSSRHYSTVFQGAVHASYINLYIFTRQTYILIIQYTNYIQ